MREWSDRKGVVVPLGLLAVTVWAYVLYTLVAAWPASESEVLVPTLRATQEIETVAHVWQDDFRDPFVGPVRSDTSVRNIRAQQVEAEVSEPLRLRLLGVVDGTAMLEKSDGSVVLARRGTEVGVGKVVAITSTSVTLRVRTGTRVISID